MEIAQISGWIGAILGTALGITGGLIGTYFSIKNTNGPRERGFMIRASIVCWILVILFLGLMFILPSPHRYLLWIPYAILLPLGIVVGNRIQKRIMEEESGGAH